MEPYSLRSPLHLTSYLLALVKLYRELSQLQVIIWCNSFIPFMMLKIYNRQSWLNLTVMDNHGPLKNEGLKGDQLPGTLQNYQKSFIKEMMLGSRPGTQA